MLEKTIKWDIEMRECILWILAHVLNNPLEYCRDTDECDLGTRGAGVIGLCGVGGNPRQGELVVICPDHERGSAVSLAR